MASRSLATVAETLGSRPDRERGRRRRGWLLAHASESGVRLRVVVDQAGSKHTGHSRNRDKGGQPAWPITRRTVVVVEMRTFAEKQYLVHGRRGLLRGGCSPATERIHVNRVGTDVRVQHGGSVCNT